MEVEVDCTNGLAGMAQEHHGSGIGDLAHFPFELVQHIIAFLPVADVWKFRAINGNTRFIVDSMIAWQELLRHVPAAEERIFQRGVATTIIDVHTLYSNIRGLCCDTPDGCILTQGKDPKLRIVSYWVGARK